MSQPEAFGCKGGLNEREEVAFVRRTRIAITTPQCRGPQYFRGNSERGRSPGWLEFHAASGTAFVPVGWWRGGAAFADLADTLSWPEGKGVPLAGP